MKQFRIAFAAALLLALAQATNANGVRKDQFISCLKPSTPSFPVGTQEHKNITSRGFRNNFAIPSAIVLASSPAHVSDAVRCARRTGHTVCVRSGGHSLIGTSLCAGVLIDVGPMRSVKVDSRTGVATIGVGANLGETLWALHGAGRWFAAGVCPGVGVGGYVLGGGHGPYEGKLGLTCDSLEEVTLVDRNGWIIKASAKERSGLFWGLCGAGGAQFGIATSFKIRTVDVKPYDNAVYFRYNWQQRYVGQLLEKWLRYDEMGGLVRIRMEINKDSDGANGLGICFNVTSTRECEQRLESAEFFGTPGRTRKLIKKAENALEVHAFYGPQGDWGKMIPTDIKDGFLSQRYVDVGRANGRTYHSTFINAHPSAHFWQQYADYCVNPPLKTVPWTLCLLTLFKNGVNEQRDNAFAYRDSRLLTHYIMGGGSKEERMSAYAWMTNKFAPIIRGVYVNYQELELKNYAKMYWGKNLCRLRKLKTVFDPNLFFANPQPIPPTSWKNNDECTSHVVRTLVHNRVSKSILRRFVKM